MTDLEHEVSLMLEEKGQLIEATPLRPPPGFVRRARRRQLRTGVLATALAVAIGFGSLAGVQALVRGFDSRPADREPKGTQVHLTTGGVRVSVPQGWRPVSLWGSNPMYVGERDGPVAAWPILQVTNVAQTGTGSRCPDSAGAMGSSGVLLYVEEVFFRGEGPRVGGWPVQPGPPAALGPSCRSSRPTYWSAKGRVLRAFVASGREAGPEDRAAVVAAFESLRFMTAPVKEPASQWVTIPLGDRVTVLTGSTRGKAWRLTVQKTSMGPCFEFDWEGGVWSPFGGAGSVPGTETDCPFASGLSLDVRVYGLRETWRDTDRNIVTFYRGSVTLRAARVVVELEDGRTVEAAVAQVPAELGHDYGPAPTFAGMSVEPFAVWVAPARGSVRAATFLAYDAAGKLIGKNRLDCVPDTVCG